MDQAREEVAFFGEDGEETPNVGEMRRKFLRWMRRNKCFSVIATIGQTFFSVGFISTESRGVTG